MTLRRFKPADLLDIDDWYTQWKMAPPFGGNVPPVGYIIPGVAAGFLGQTDFQVAFIEGLIANPRANKDERDDALNLIVSTIERTAKELGFKIIVGLTQRDAVLSRAKRHFFRVHGDFTMVAKEIG